MSAEVLELTLVAVEKAGILANGNKPLPKFFMASMKEVLLHSNKSPNPDHEQEVSSLKEYISTLEGNISTLEGKLTALEGVLSDKDKTISKLSKDTEELQNQTDASNQYNRRDNIKITGVPFTQDENLNEIIKDISKHIGREVAEHEISDAHRIHVPAETSGGVRIPTIICRLNRRTVKYDLFAKKKHLRSYPHPKYANLGIYEDLSPLRSRMLYALRNKTNDNGAKTFKYTWSKEGRLYCRTEQQTQVGPGQKLPKPGVVNKPDDLMKMGFSKTEVEQIVNNIRK